ncbi:MAG TPA: cysteine desulfurase family protein [Candidatus Baltobacteraceae bacterium]|nr:cysteine desulfurase family protein [Candidatus Baltobacteraceae bacterium]
MTPRIYLDFAATTPVDPSVVESMLPYFTEHGYNPSSVHTEGRAARAALDDARDRVARVLGSARKEITFVASGSEADNQAILGIARRHSQRGKHIVSSAIEHHAVLHALDVLAAEGFEITLLPVDESGRIDAVEFEASLRADTTLATIAYANNEIGVVQPIARLAEIAREHGVIFHTDAIQAPGWLPIQVGPLGVDLVSLSAHKFYGPKGVGVLYARDGVSIPPLVHGGGQEFGRRSGTENVAGIVGLATALERAAADQPVRAERVAKMRDRLEREILERVPDARINGAGAVRLPNNANISFGGVDSETLLMRLDLEGIAVSAGSACTSGALEPSHVIAALGIDSRWHEGVIRFSLGASTQDAEIDRVIDVLQGVVVDLRGNRVSARKAPRREGEEF